MKNSKQSDTILENSPKGDSEPHRAAENAVKEAQGMIRMRKMLEEKWKGVMDNRHLILLACDARRSDHHEVQDGR